MKPILFSLSMILSSIFIPSSPARCEDLLIISRPIERPFLWEIKKDGKTSFVFGTLHKGINTEDMPDFFWNSFNQSTAYLMELDAKQPIDKKLLQLPEGQTLDQYLSPTVLAELKKNAGENFDASQSIALATFGFLGQLAKSIIPADLVKHSLDRDLMERAKTQGKQIVYLEERSQAMAAAFVGLTPALLEWTVLHLDREQYRRDVFDMFRLYQDGDELAYSELSYQVQVRKRALDNFRSVVMARTRLWLPKIIDAHANGPVFVAVGAQHIGGSYGLLNLLKESGFEVRRVER